MFRKMRRFKQQISEEECMEVLLQEKRGVLSVLGDDGYPYGVPIDYVYVPDEVSIDTVPDKTAAGEGENPACGKGKIYFHGARAGHKIDAIRACDKVSFCTWDEGWRKEGEWALNIRSVVVFGRIREVQDHEKAMEICRKLCLKFTQDEDYIRQELARSGKAVQVLELSIEHMTGKLVNES